MGAEPINIKNEAAKPYFIQILAFGKLLSRNFNDFLNSVIHSVPVNVKMICCSYYIAEEEIGLQCI